MPTCKEVSRAVASGTFEDGPWYRRFGCWLHLLMCPRCKRYHDEIEAIGEAARQEAVMPDADRLADIEAEVLRRLA